MTTYKTTTLNTLAHNECHIWQACVDGVSKEQFDTMFGSLSSEEQSRANRFLLEKHKNMFILTHSMLRQIISCYLHILPDEILIEKNNFGKPKIKKEQCAIPLNFNLSHSKNLVLFAFTLEYEVGIDIEYIRAVKGYKKIAQKVFSQKEIHALSSLSNEDQTIGFFNCWTRKEAFIKALGVGMHYPLKQFSVDICSGREYWNLQDDNIDTKNWSFVSLDLKDFAAALAVTGKIDTISFTQHLIPICKNNDTIHKV